jgi:hypothetical protein
MINDIWVCYKGFNSAHSVHAGSSLSCLALLSFFLLLHVATFLAGAKLLISPSVWGAWPSLAPFPWADSISLRSQAAPYPPVGHTSLWSQWSDCGVGGGVWGWFLIGPGNPKDTQHWNSVSYLAKKYPVSICTDLDCKWILVVMMLCTECTVQPGWMISIIAPAPLFCLQSEERISILLAGLC